MPDLTLARKVYENGLHVAGSDDHYAAYHLAKDVLELHAREERLLVVLRHVEAIATLEPAHGTHKIRRVARRALAEQGDE